MITELHVRAALAPIQDPEMNIPILDLGLIYDIKIQQDGGEGAPAVVKIKMTLTSPACPVGPMIRAAVESAAGRIPGVSGVEVEYVWSPPWDPREMASEDAKMALGII